MDLTLYFISLISLGAGGLFTSVSWLDPRTIKFLRKKYALDYVTMLKAIEMVKDGQVTETQVDYKLLRLFISRLPKLHTLGVPTSKPILDVLKREEQIFTSPRIELVRDVLEWVEGHILLAQMNVTNTDMKNNNLLYSEWANGTRKLNQESDVIVQKSETAIRSMEQKMLGVQGERDVLAARKKFSRTAITSMEGV